MGEKTKLEQVREAIDHYSYYGGSGGHRNLTIIEALKSYAKQLENGGWRTDLESAKTGEDVLIFLEDGRVSRASYVERDNSYGDYFQSHKCVSSYREHKIKYWRKMELPKEDE